MAAGDNWEDIYQEDWENIHILITKGGDFFLDFDYIDESGFQWHYGPEHISTGDFFDIYDAAKDLEQDIEIEY